MAGFGDEGLAKFGISGEDLILVEKMGSIGEYGGEDGEDGTSEEKNGILMEKMGY